MIIRELVMSDEASLTVLIEKIESALINKDFWLPINDTSRTHFLDKKWTRFYGAFEDEELIGASALFLDQHEFGESLSQLDDATMIPDEVAEIGRSMVLPNYRGKNLLLDINRHVVEEAVRLGKKYLIATIHPDNIPSRKSFERLGMQKSLTYTKSCGYIRDIYLMELYPNDMDKLMNGNAGLKSRMPYLIEFPNYARGQLAEIFLSISRMVTEKKMAALLSMKKKR